jgi:uncharacterized protein (DUF2249 family)
MANTVSYLAQSAAPSDRPCETIDARELPPPQPLRNTLEQLAELGDSAVLVQLNDRRPQHLYPKLEDRGYQHETFEDGDVVVTVIWSP